MILLWLQAASQHDAQYLVQWRDRLKIATVPRLPRKHRIREYRSAINQAFDLIDAQYRHIDNVRINGQWYSRWKEF